MKNKIFATLTFSIFLAQAYAQNIIPNRLSGIERAQRNHEFDVKLRELEARGGSGDIVGNGGGLVEQNFQFAYDKAAEFIDQCIKKSSCGVSEDDLEILNEIKLTIISNWGSKDRLKFIPHTFSDFFHDEKDYEIRIAKTGFDPSFPILINLGLAYRNESFAYDFGAMIAIIIHEVGHQIGITDHTYLDFLGQTIRRETISRQDNYRINVNYADFNISIINSNTQSLSFPGAYVSYNDKSLSLSEMLNNKIRCPINSNPLGYRLENGHYKRPNALIHRVILVFQSWLTYYCVTGLRTVSSFDRELEIQFLLEKDKETNQFKMSDSTRITIK